MNTDAWARLSDRTQKSGTKKGWVKDCCGVMGALRLWVHLFVDALGHCSGSISTAAPTFEGAGVHLHRAFGFSEPQAVICRGLGFEDSRY